MSASFDVEIDSSEYDRLQSTVEQVRSTGILPVYKDFYRYYRERLKERYNRVSETTEYSQAWHGTAQEVSGLIRGETAKWGIDSGALYQDLTQQVNITDEGIQVWSDLPYAASILELMSEKSVYAPNSILFMDDRDIAELEDILFDWITKAFGLRVR